MYDKIHYKKKKKIHAEGRPFPDTGHYMYFVSVSVKVAQSCLTLCNPMHCTFHGILQARILEWVAFPSPRGSSQPRD